MQSSEWQPLPVGARTMYVLNGACWALPTMSLALLGAMAAGLDAGGVGCWALVGAVAGTLLGCWRGWRVWGCTAWRLDDAGFTLRRGHLWRSETRVPQSRVQHLDLQRGPLQRHFGLSTLVIHTAGTRHSAVAVRGLDAGDAERLRDILARQVDDDDDDLDA